MKIVYIHQYFVFPDRAGGTRSYDLSTSFQKKGYDVEIITSSALIQNVELKNGWNYVQKDGLKLHILKLPYGNEFSYIKRTFVFFKFLVMASMKALSVKCDILIATSTPLTIGIPALVKRWLHKTPFIFETRDVWPEAVIAIGAVKNRIVQKLLFSLERLIYKNASAIVPLSNDMKASIISRYPDLSQKPVEVIENISQIRRFTTGIDSSRSLIEERLGFKPKFTVLYAGTFGKVNGIHYVIDLAEKLLQKNSEVSFILIGPGGEKNKIIELANEKNLTGKNVFFWDSIPKSALPQVYFEADMGSSFVIPIEELWANSANKFFDSLAASRPILINYGGWQKQLILNENLGYVLPEKLSDDIVDKFIEYTQNKDLQVTQRVNAFRKANEAFSLDVAVRKYLNVIERVKRS